MFVRGFVYTELHSSLLVVFTNKLFYSLNSNDVFPLNSPISLTPNVHLSALCLNQFQINRFKGVLFLTLPYTIPLVYRKLENSKIEK